MSCHPDLAYTVTFRYLRATALHKTAMALPNGRHAIVDPSKIRDYLLHPKQPKSVVFTALGYTVARSTVLQEDIRAFASHDAHQVGRPSDFGTNYLVSAKLEGPNGKSAIILTVWLVRNGEDFPRFITAYPDKGQP